MKKTKSAQTRRLCSKIVTKPIPKVWKRSDLWATRNEDNTRRLSHFYRGTERPCGQQHKIWGKTVLIEMKKSNTAQTRRLCLKIVPKPIPNVWKRSDFWALRNEDNTRRLSHFYRGTERPCGQQHKIWGKTNFNSNEKVKPRPNSVAMFENSTKTHPHSLKEIWFMGIEKWRQRTST